MTFAMTSHARRGAYLGLALLLCTGAASAQMYKWVDANGKTHFTDTPPPPTAKAAPIKAVVSGTNATELPFALASAVRNHPVTLYTTTPCGGCDSGRAFLRSKGIPFTEKTVSTGADEEKLREAGGEGQLPMLVVGRSKMTGFQGSTWLAALLAASYPENPMLPSNYQYPPPVAAAPRPQKAAEPDKEALRIAAAEAEEQRRKKARAPTAPPGFQF